MTNTTIVQKNISRAAVKMQWHNREEVKKILRETAGIWRGRKIDPIRYQRAMRKSYALERMK